jgi:hypothetical protein
LMAPLISTQACTSRLNLPVLEEQKSAVAHGGTGM